VRSADGEDLGSGSDTGSDTARSVFKDDTLLDGFRDLFGPGQVTVNRKVLLSGFHTWKELIEGTDDLRFRVRFTHLDIVGGDDVRGLRYTSDLESWFGVMYGGCTELSRSKYTSQAGLGALIIHQLTRCHDSPVVLRNLPKRDGRKWNEVSIPMPSVPGRSQTHGIQQSLDPRQDL
jgi:hypothetical protein